MKLDFEEGGAASLFPTFGSNIPIQILCVLDQTKSVFIVQLYISSSLY